MKRSADVRWLSPCCLPRGRICWGPGGDSRTGSFVVCSALDEKTTNALAAEFTRRTGTRVELLNVAAEGTLAARIQSEAATAIRAKILLICGCALAGLLVAGVVDMPSLLFLAELGERVWLDIDERGVHLLSD